MFFLFLRTHGELAEWSNAVVLKTIVPKGTGVRIPHSPLFFNLAMRGFFVFNHTLLFKFIF